MNKASNRTKENLKRVDERLVMLVGYALAISEVDFFVNEGLRNTETQQKYFKQGSSQLDGVIKKSKHQVDKAIDVYYVGWTNEDDKNDPRWKTLIDAFRLAGNNLGLELEFGYDWGWDKPHIELKG